MNYKLKITDRCIGLDKNSPWFNISYVIKERSKDQFFPAEDYEPFNNKNPSYNGCVIVNKIILSKLLQVMYNDV